MALAAADLIANPPHLHGFKPSGEPESWSLAPEALTIIDGLLEPEWRTVETGAGVSTILFALRGTEHTCIVPAPDQVERILAFCEENGISTERLDIVLELSEEALPQLELTDIDLVLIDGSHSFPSVFIDWYYTADKLKVDGWLVVDDTNLWTGRVLRDFLISEPEWSLVREVPMRAAFFRKIAATHGVRNWVYQPYVVSRSMLTPGRRALTMLRDRNFGALLTKARRRLRSRGGG